MADKESRPASGSTIKAVIGLGIASAVAGGVAGWYTLAPQTSSASTTTTQQSSSADTSNSSSVDVNTGQGSAHTKTSGS